MSGKKFFYNALILCCVSIIMRIVGVTFNAYISNKIGAAAMGLFTLVMSAYSFAVAFAISGVGLAATRLTAEAIGRGSDAEIRQAMKSCIIYALVFGCAAGVLLFSLSGFIGETLLGDKRTILSLKTLAVSLPFLALCSAISGYFTAVRRVIKSASAALLEQFIKINVTVTALSILMPGGLEYACLSIVIGIAISEIITLVYLISLYIHDLWRHNKNSGNVKKDLSKTMLGIALPVALSTYVRSGLLTIEHMLIPRGLRKSGATNERSLASYGVLSGMVIPVVLFPQAFLSAFSGLLVPELAKHMARGEKERIKSIVSRVMQITLCFSIGISGIMLSFSHELGSVIYNEAEAGVYINLLAPLIPIMYLDNAIDNMLKGLNEQLHAMRINILDAFLSVILVIFMLPAYGIRGYIAVIFICELLNFTMSSSRLMKVTKVEVRLVKWVIKPLICVVGATSCTRLFFILSGILFRYESIELVINIIMALALYLLFLILTNGVSKSDIKWIKRTVK